MRLVRRTHLCGFSQAHSLGPAWAHTARHQVAPAVNTRPPTEAAFLSAACWFYGTPSAPPIDFWKWPSRDATKPTKTPPKAQVMRPVNIAAVRYAKNAYLASAARCLLSALYRRGYIGGGTPRFSPKRGGRRPCHPRRCNAL
jgi:hypothetical protein